jgi:lysophospholipase L1-like esterase
MVPFLPILAHLLLATNGAQPPLQLKDGDCVVLIGSTLIEREQRFGYWESAITCRFPGKNVRFRNLGWSGDTVFGEAQAGFGTAADGFRHLTEHVLALKPTVVIVGYGTNESFDGPDGLPRFVGGLNKLLDALAPAKARVILLSPTQQEDLGRPLPDPAGANANLELYTDAIRKEAERRKLLFVDLFHLPQFSEEKSIHLTDNEVHFTAYGYWRTAPALTKALGLRDDRWVLELGGKERVVCKGAYNTVSTTGEKSAVVVWDAILPGCALTTPPDGAVRVVKAFGLPAGTSYQMTVDGSPTVKASAEQWAAGVALTSGPEFDQTEKLRATIVGKNRLYFHRWRPQNETYLFGFRKHEQGQNAREIPQFDPLVAEAEKQITALSVPRQHTYELKRCTTK